jgi:hypothetical protein
MIVFVGPIVGISFVDIPFFRHFNPHSEAFMHIDSTWRVERPPYCNTQHATTAHNDIAHLRLTFDDIVDMCE